MNLCRRLMDMSQEEFLIVRKSLKNGGPSATRTRDQLVKSKPADQPLNACFHGNTTQSVAAYFQPEVRLQAAVCLVSFRFMPQVSA